MSMGKYSYCMTKLGCIRLHLSHEKADPSRVLTLSYSNYVVGWRCLVVGRCTPVTLYSAMTFLAILELGERRLGLTGIPHKTLIAL